MTKLEKIALAIHRARYPDAPVMDMIDCLGPTVEAQALIEARAAVEDLREPTEAMAEAGAMASYEFAGDAFVSWDDFPEHQKVELRNATKAAHRAMIDAILTEK